MHQGDKSLDLHDIRKQRGTFDGEDVNIEGLVLLVIQ
jgi:hypothetical protein